MTDQGKHRVVICDIETDGLDANVIHCICCLDVRTKEEFTFTAKDFDTEWVEFAKTVRKWIGHNFLGFDAPVINRLTPVTIKVDEIEDTLILSRIVSPIMGGGHSLDAWGKRLGIHKLEFNNFSKLTDEMITYCLMDLQVCLALRNHLIPTLRSFSLQSIELEHQTQYVLDTARKRGFYLDVDKARGIYLECKGKADDIESRIQELFPPVLKPVVEGYQPRINKDGSMSKQSLNRIERADHYEKYSNGTYDLFKYETFNLGSQKQVIERLNVAGWKPYVKTKGGKPKICEENLNTIPDHAAEARELKDWLTFSSRLRVIQNWLDHYNPDTSRVHGTIIGLGASTHRMAHRNPQMGNIPAVRNVYGREMRECWTVEDLEKYCIVGTDISGIQLCILAHLMENPEYTQAIANGDKDKGTDVHSVNMRFLQEIKADVDRDIAKTFIYAMLLGAGMAKLGSIIGGNSRDGRRAKELLFNKIPGFKKVQRLCKNAARRGYLTTIDGRRITVPSEHFALAIYLQSNEAIIMKKTAVLTRQRAVHLDWHLLTVVHDEMQAECLREHAEELGKVQVQAITDAGEFYNLKCPLTGETKIGANWAETH